MHLKLKEPNTAALMQDKKDFRFKSVIEPKSAFFKTIPIEMPAEL